MSSDAALGDKLHSILHPNAIDQRLKRLERDVRRAEHAGYDDSPPGAGVHGTQESPIPDVSEVTLSLGQETSSDGVRRMTLTVAVAASSPSRTARGFMGYNVRIISPNGETTERYNLTDENSLLPTLTVKNVVPVPAASSPPSAWYVQLQTLSGIYGPSRWSEQFPFTVGTSTNVADPASLTLLSNIFQVPTQDAAVTVRVARPGDESNITNYVIEGTIGSVVQHQEVYLSPPIPAGPFNITFTGRYPQTYSIRVRAISNGTVGNSNWVGPLTGTMHPNPVSGVGPPISISQNSGFIQGQIGDGNQPYRYTYTPGSGGSTGQLIEVSGGGGLEIDLSSTVGDTVTYMGPLHPVPALSGQPGLLPYEDHFTGVFQTDSALSAGKLRVYAQYHSMTLDFAPRLLWQNDGTEGIAQFRVHAYIVPNGQAANGQLRLEVESDGSSNIIFVTDLRLEPALTGSDLITGPATPGTYSFPSALSVDRAGLVTAVTAGEAPSLDYAAMIAFGD